MRLFVERLCACVWGNISRAGMGVFFCACVALQRVLVEVHVLAAERLLILGRLQVERVHLRLVAVRIRRDLDVPQTSLPDETRVHTKNATRKGFGCTCITSTFVSLMRDSCHGMAESEDATHRAARLTERDSRVMDSPEAERGAGAVAVEDIGEFLGAGGRHQVPTEKHIRCNDSQKVC